MTLIHNHSAKVAFFRQNYYRRRPTRPEIFHQLARWAKKGQQKFYEISSFHKTINSYFLACATIFESFRPYQFFWKTYFVLGQNIRSSPLLHHTYFFKFVLCALNRIGHTILPLDPVVQIGLKFIKRKQCNNFCN